MGNISTNKLFLIIKDKNRNLFNENSLAREGEKKFKRIFNLKASKK